MGLSWNRFLLLAFFAGILICVSFWWLLGHEETRILLVGPRLMPQIGLMIMLASLAMLALLYSLGRWLLFGVIPFLLRVRRYGWNNAQAMKL